jgi:hypothetical protein
LPANVIPAFVSSTGTGKLEGDRPPPAAHAGSAAPTTEVLPRNVLLDDVLSAQVLPANDLPPASNGLPANVLPTDGTTAFVLPPDALVSSTGSGKLDGDRPQPAAHAGSEAPTNEVLPLNGLLDDVLPAHVLPVNDLPPASCVLPANVLPTVGTTAYVLPPDVLPVLLDEVLPAHVRPANDLPPVSSVLLANVLPTDGTTAYVLPPDVLPKDISPVGVLPADEDVLPIASEFLPANVLPMDGTTAYVLLPDVLPDDISPFGVLPADEADVVGPPSYAAFVRSELALDVKDYGGLVDQNGRFNGSEQQFFDIMFRRIANDQEYAARFKAFSQKFPK